MNSQRRTFIRNMGITLLGMPLASNAVFSASLNSLNNSNSRVSLINRLKNDGFEVLYDKSYQLNANCKAIPILKKNFLWPNEEGLLVTMNNHDAFVLDSKQVKAYKEFISNFKTGLDVNGTADTSIVKQVATPKKILKTNKTNDFRFKNAQGQIVEVKSYKKQGFVKLT